MEFKKSRILYNYSDALIINKNQSLHQSFETKNKSELNLHIEPSNKILIWHLKFLKPDHNIQIAMNSRNGEIVVYYRTLYSNGEEHITNMHNYLYKFNNILWKTSDTTLYSVQLHLYEVQKQEQLSNGDRN